MRCPLCGFEFEATALSCHSSCAFNDACGIVCCPNCGYQMPDEQKSRIASALRRFIARKRAEPADLPLVRPLSTLLAGQSAKVVSIRSDNHARVEKLSIFGLTPEAHVRVEQQRPTFILRVGFTELSIEREIADDVFVEIIA